MFPYYRDMLTTLAGGLTAREIILNGLSAAPKTLPAAGRHMSNHFAKPAINIHNTSSCVSNHIAARRRPGPRDQDLSPTRSEGLQTLKT